MRGGRGLRAAVRAENGGAVRGLGGGGSGRGLSAELLGAGFPRRRLRGRDEEAAARRATLPERSLPSPGRFGAALPKGKPPEQFPVAKEALWSGVCLTEIGVSVPECFQGRRNS